MPTSGNKQRLYSCLIANTAPEIVQMTVAQLKEALRQEGQQTSKANKDLLQRRLFRWRVACGAIDLHRRAQ